MSSTRLPRPVARAIGVDSDQYQTVDDPAQQAVIMTSMLKRVDVAVKSFVGDFVDGNVEGGTDVVYDLEGEGVGLATSGGFIDDIQDADRRVPAADHRRRHQGPDDPVIQARARDRAGPRLTVIRRRVRAHAPGPAVAVRGLPGPGSPRDVGVRDHAAGRERRSIPSPADADESTCAAHPWTHPKERPRWPQQE